MKFPQILSPQIIIAKLPPPLDNKRPDNYPPIIFPPRKITTPTFAMLTIISEQFPPGELLPGKLATLMKLPPGIPP